MNRDEAQQFHLFVERPAPVAHPLPVPPGISHMPPAGEKLHAAVSEPVSPSIPMPCFEPVMNQHGQLRLLLVHSTDARVRVNGIVAPLVTLLKEGDFVQFADGFAAHVSILNRPRMGPPPTELLGHECPVCRVKFSPDITCYLCACGAAFHAEDGPEGLQCAQTRTDCVCGRPIILTEGFNFQPDLPHA